MRGTDSGIDKFNTTRALILSKYPKAEELLKDVEHTEAEVDELAHVLVLIELPKTEADAIVAALTRHGIRNMVDSITMLAAINKKNLRLREISDQAVEALKKMDF